jgi:hypothetical protein
MKLVENSKNLWKSYSVISHVLNLLVAISAVGLSALPILSDYIAPGLLFGIVGCLSLAGLVGRYVKQSLDEEKDKEDV